MRIIAYFYNFVNPFTTAWRIDPVVLLSHELRALYILG